MSLRGGVKAQHQGTSVERRRLHPYRLASPFRNQLQPF